MNSRLTKEQSPPPRTELIAPGWAFQSLLRRGLIRRPAMVVGIMSFVGCSGPKNPPPPIKLASPNSLPIQFRNVVESVGIRFRWPPLPKPMRIHESTAGGCAFLDFDDDG